MLLPLAMSSMSYDSSTGHIVRPAGQRGKGGETLFVPLNELHCARIGNSLANLPLCAHCIEADFMLREKEKIKVKSHR